MWARNGRWILPEMPDFHVAFRNLLHAVNLRHGTDFPSEGRHAEDFFALKNPTASAGFEPTNLGTKGQHATSRPPKPLFFWLTEVVFIKWMHITWLSKVDYLRIKSWEVSRWMTSIWKCLLHNYLFIIGFSKSYILFTYLYVTAL